MSHGTFSVDSVIREHHVYKDTWMSFVGEDLMCQRELGIHSPFLYLAKDSAVVGHLPLKHSII